MLVICSFAKKCHKRQTLRPEPRYVCLVFQLIIIGVGNVQRYISVRIRSIISDAFFYIQDMLCTEKRQLFAADKRVFLFSFFALNLSIAPSIKSALFLIKRSITAIVTAVDAET